MFKESYLHDYDLIKKKISNTTQDDLFQKQLPPPPLDELSTELLKVCYCKNKTKKNQIKQAETTLSVFIYELQQTIPYIPNG